MTYALIGFGTLAIVGLWVLLYRARRAGEAGLAARVTKETADVLKRQGEAVVNAPVGKEAVVNRLREKGL